MTKLLTSAAGAFIALAVAMTVATAQPARSADDLYKEGSKQYNLGNFDKAIENFKAAYALQDKPAYLYNIAQAYRQLGDCKNAVFFYKRFLSLKASDTVKPLSASLKAEIEGRITELDACAKEADAIKNRPPDADLQNDGTGDGKTGDGKTGDGKTGDGKTGDGTTGDGTGPDVAANDDDDDTDDDPDGTGVGISAGTQIAPPSVVAARLAVGGAKVFATGLKVPIQVSIALTAGYPITLAPNFTLELGAGFTFTPVPYNKGGGETGRASLIGLLGNIGATYALSPKLDLHGDLGAGVLLFGGLDQGNQFTDMMQETTGALTMFNLRVAATVEYAVTQNFMIVGTPIAFSYSPAHEGLNDNISALVRLDFMLGVGYRM